MFGPRLKIDKSLYERVRKAAELAGYSSPDEFIVHVLEREVSALEEAEADDKVEERLRGLGYIE